MRIAVFALLGTIQFLSKQMLEALPNVELVSTLTMVYTLVYRRQALIPIFLFILMEGVLWGFGLWWFPYLYLWPIGAQRRYGISIQSDNIRSADIIP